LFEPRLEFFVGGDLVEEMITDEPHLVGLPDLGVETVRVFAYSERLLGKAPG
jgi:hypothetical protein